jgi:hypothetical protein
MLEIDKVLRRMELVSFGLIYNIIFRFRFKREKKTHVG